MSRREISATETYRLHIREMMCREYPHIHHVPFPVHRLRRENAGRKKLSALHCRIRNDDYSGRSLPCKRSAAVRQIDVNTASNRLRHGKFNSRNRLPKDIVVPRHIEPQIMQQVMQSDIEAHGFPCRSAFIQSAELA